MYKKDQKNDVINFIFFRPQFHVYTSAYLGPTPRLGPTGLTSLD